uniref:Uncharacterized protein n=1 Tax=Anguilla anguilla TaxID=7936 RepID=A0A0E9PL24_ANGAN
MQKGHHSGDSARTRTRLLLVSRTVTLQGGVCSVLFHKCGIRTQTPEEVGGKLHQWHFTNLNR